MVTQVSSPRVSDRGRLDATAKATGSTRYVADIQRPRLAYAAVARSTRSHTTIKSIDIKAALALPGVVGVFTSDDVSRHLYGRGLRGRADPSAWKGSLHRRESSQPWSRTAGSEQKRQRL